MAEIGIYTSAAFINGTGLEVAASASVEVRKESDNTLASLFSDRAGASGINNPFNADSEGRFEFYVAGLPAGFKVTVTKGLDEHILRNQPVGTIQERDSIDVLGLFNAAEPSPTYKYMWWADPATGKLKQRNAANDGWIIKQTLATVIEDFTTVLLNKLNGITAGAEVNPALIPQAEIEAGIATTERVISAERFKQGVVAQGGGGALVELESISASNSPSIDFDSGVDFSLYKRYLFFGVDIDPATDGTDLMVRVSINGGSSYRSTAADYFWMQNWARNNASAQGIRWESTDNTAYRLTGADTPLDNTNPSSTAGFLLNLYNPSNTTRDIMMDARATVWDDSAGRMSFTDSSGVFAGSPSDDVDGLQFLMSSGNITSGEFICYGVV